MSYEHLELQRNGDVVTCVISNPPTQTLTGRGVVELLALLSEIESDPSTRVLVLTGGGQGVFITHYEVGELADSAEQNIANGAGSSPSPSAPEATPAARLHAFHQLCLQLEGLRAITVAAINGSAAGGGCELSLACDFRLLADGPHLYGLPETSVGIIPGGGGTQRLARLLGNARALDLTLHAQLLSPAEALQLGLVHRVLPCDSFAAEVAAFAADLAGRAPIAMAAAKRAIHQGSQLPLVEGLAVEQECFDRTLRSRDAAGAMRAYLSGQDVGGYEWQGE